MASFLDEYFSKQELSRSLGISIRTLDRWHTLREGPPRTRAGKKIFFKKDSVRDWLEDRTEPSGRAAGSNQRSVRKASRR